MTKALPIGDATCDDCGAPLSVVRSADGYVDAIDPATDSIHVCPRQVPICSDCGFEITDRQDVDYDDVTQTARHTAAFHREL